MGTNKAAKQLSMSRLKTAADVRLPTINSNFSLESVVEKQDRYAGMVMEHPPTNKIEPWKMGHTHLVPMKNDSIAGCGIEEYNTVTSNNTMLIGGYNKKIHTTNRHTGGVMMSRRLIG